MLDPKPSYQQNLRLAGAKDCRCCGKNFASVQCSVIRRKALMSNRKLFEVRSTHSSEVGSEGNP